MNHGNYREMKIINKPINQFELLREKSILAILDGDTDFGTLKINGTDSGIKISIQKWNRDHRDAVTPDTSIARGGDRLILITGFYH